MKTRAELSNYEETSRYTDVLAFFGDLEKKSPLVRVSTFGQSKEGRDLPLIVIADPPVATPRQAHDSGKTIVFVLANIHAGEVEGKEASQEIARRLAGGKLHQVLSKVVVLIAPIYNADGNERIALTNRTEQNGPIGGVGVRENAQGLDLNRDFMKMEAPETRALIRLFNEWDPHLTVDSHTTDGSFHGYHLTYSVPLNPSTDGPLVDYHRDKMLPALTKAMLRKHRFRTYYYGNFAPEDSVARQAIYPGEPGGVAKGKRVWRTFSPQPRVGFNYVGLRNRLCILSEAYSYLDFRRRIEVTSAFVEEILVYASDHAAEIRRLTEAADQRAASFPKKRGAGAAASSIPIECVPKALSAPVPILVGEVVTNTNPRSGTKMRAMVEDKITPVKMLDFGLFAAARNAPRAQAYLIPDQDALRPAIQKMRDHGITIETLDKPLTTTVSEFTIQNVKRAARRFQGHDGARLEGTFAEKEMTFAPGTLVVSSSQPLGVLAACLLEPESDDGFVTWNFLDDFLKPQAVYPIYKLMPTPLPKRGAALPK